MKTVEWVSGKTINISNSKYTGSWTGENKLWEKPLIENVYNTFKNTNNFIYFDIGANLGSYTLLVKEFDDSFCYAFEPNNYILGHLRDSIKLNGCEHKVKLENVALSNENGTTILNIPNNDESGLGCLGENPLRFNDYIKQNVTTMTLDTYVEQYNVQKIDFIKIDTEGWELYILKGAVNSITKFRPIIQLEIYDINMKQCNVKKEELLKFLDTLGYKYNMISHEDLWCVPI
jgi:FkbM family methyltransferase